MIQHNLLPGEVILSGWIISHFTVIICIHERFGKLRLNLDYVLWPNGDGSVISPTMFPVYLCSHSTDSNSIKVFVRVRPFTHGTELTTDGDQSLCLTVTSPNTIRLLSKPEPRTFTYDHVADMDTSQVHILWWKHWKKIVVTSNKMWLHLAVNDGFDCGRICWSHFGVIFSNIEMFLCRMLYSLVWPRILSSLAWMDIMEPYLLSKIHFLSALLYNKDQNIGCITGAISLNPFLFTFL